MNLYNEKNDYIDKTNKREIKRFQGSETVLLTAMLGAFIGGIGCTFFDRQFAAILCFLAHGCLSLVYIMISQNRMLDDLSCERMRADDALAQLDRQRDNTEKLAALQKEYESCARKLGAAEQSIAELLDAQNTPEAQPCESAAAEYAGSLLPEPAKSTVLDILAVTRDVIQETEPFCARSHVQVQLSSSSESLPVKADAGYLRILFRNIIDNSVKYMQRGGSLVITLSLVGTDLFIVLKDNGAGLPAQETAHIFELNYQGSNRVSGNGLGLAQSKAIVEYYGGTIYAKSSVDAGMAIYIQLPACPDSV